MVELQKEPAGQVVHVVTPPSEYVPAAHADRVLTLSENPAGMLLQTVLPAGAYWPALQAMAVSVPGPGQAKLAGQVVQTVLTAAVLALVPGGQSCGATPIMGQA